MWTPNHWTPHPHPTREALLVLNVLEGVVVGFYWRKKGWSGKVVVTTGPCGHRGLVTTEVLFTFVFFTVIPFWEDSFSPFPQSPCEGPVKRNTQRTTYSCCSLWLGSLNDFQWTASKCVLLLFCLTFFLNRCQFIFCLVLFTSLAQHFTQRFNECTKWNPSC